MYKNKSQFAGLVLLALNLVSISAEAENIFQKIFSRKKTEETQTLPKLKINLGLPKKLLHQKILQAILVTRTLNLAIHL